MTSAPAIGFEYRPSRLGARLAAGMAGLAALAILISGLPFGAKLLLWVILAAAALRALRRFGQAPVSAAGWAGDGGWSLRLTGAEDRAAALVSGRVLGPFVYLRLRPAEGSSFDLLLAPDNSDADLRRRLRMRLAASAPAEAPPRA
jgi:toxin CptA